MRPMFKTPHDALAFAYRYTKDQYDRPASSKMADGECSVGVGLGGLDGAGQAGMIKRHVLALPLTYRLIVTLRYAPRTTPCLCCGGDRPAPEWTSAVRQLSEIAAAAALSGCISNNRLREGIIRRLMGEKIVLADLAEHCGVDADTATKHNQRIARWLRGEKGNAPNRHKGEEERAMEAIDDALTDAGHVGAG